MLLFPETPYCGLFSCQQEIEFKEQLGKMQIFQHQFTSQFILQSMWKLVAAQMFHLYAAHQQWDRTDVSSVNLAEAYSVL